MGGAGAESFDLADDYAGAGMITLAAKPARKRAKRRSPVETFLSALFAEGGPYIDPAAPPEVWAAWRALAALTPQD